jgi:hypothetical protein
MSHLDEAIIIFGFCALILSNINQALFFITFIIYCVIGTRTYVAPISHTTKVITLIIEIAIIIIALISVAWQIRNDRRIKNHEKNIRSTILNAFIMKEMDKIYQRKHKSNR